MGSPCWSAASEDKLQGCCFSNYCRLHLDSSSLLPTYSLLSWNYFVALSQKQLSSSLPQNSDSFSPNSLAGSSSTIWSQSFCFSVFLLMIEETEPRALCTLSRKDLHQPYHSSFILLINVSFSPHSQRRDLGSNHRSCPPMPRVNAQHMEESKRKLVRNSKWLVSYGSCHLNEYA